MVRRILEGIEILDGMVSWEKLGLVFDHTGALGAKKNNTNGTMVYLRFVATPRIIENISSFLNTGSINKGPHPENGKIIFEINRKDELLDFFLNVRPYAPLRDRMIDFLIKNYNFDKTNHNINFDIEKFENLKEQWKLRVKEKGLLKKKRILAPSQKEKEEESLNTTGENILQGEELQGGEE